MNVEIVVAFMTVCCFVHGAKIKKTFGTQNKNVRIFEKGEVLAQKVRFIRQKLTFFWQKVRVKVRF